MDILLVGLNHTTAPVEIREQLAFREAEIPEVLPLLRKNLGAEELLLLSTCNRTELLAVARPADKIDSNTILNALCEVRSRPFISLETHIYEFRGEEAIRHLFHVAAGIDSMVLGEPQILGQFRQAYSLACQAETAGLFVNRACHRAFSVGKRVRTETDLGYGAVSAAYVAVSLAKKVFSQLNRHTALIIGAGEMAEAAATHLKEHEIGELLFVNRTEEKAQQLAVEFEAEAVPWDDLFQALERADVVISSTGAPHFILTHTQFHGIMDKRRNRPIFLIDLAVPRDVDPEINNHDNAFVYDIDSLQQVADQNLARRKSAIPAAQKIINQEVAGFHRWQENLRVEPVIKMMHERLEEIRRMEMAKTGRRLDDAHIEDMDKLTLAIQKKILHKPTEILRQIDPETAEGQRTLEIIKNLFNLQ